VSSASRQLSATHRNSRAKITSITTVPLESVRSPQSAGWLTPRQAQALLYDTFGFTVSVRTIQAWARDKKHPPLRHARLGHKLVIFRDDLLARVTA
jgi:hypothetical protein